MPTVKIQRKKIVLSAEQLQKIRDVMSLKKRPFGAMEALKNEFGLSTGGFYSYVNKIKKELNAGAANLENSDVSVTPRGILKQNKTKKKYTKNKNKEKAQKQKLVKEEVKFSANREIRLPFKEYSIDFVTREIVIKF